MDGRCKNKIMNFYGYQKDDDKLLELEEISLQCNLSELHEIIEFLNKVKTEHTTALGKTDMCHSHFRDWNSSWNREEPDFIIVTKFDT